MEEEPHVTERARVRQRGTAAVRAVRHAGHPPGSERSARGVHGARERPIGGPAGLPRGPRGDGRGPGGAGHWVFAPL